MKVPGVAMVTIALSLHVGCADLLGLEDVVRDGAGGAGGGGAGIPSGATVTTTSSASVAPSSSTGGGCAPVAACGGAVPSDFATKVAFLAEWEVQQERAEVRGEKLELEAEDEDEVASVVARSALVHELGTTCAVWVSLERKGGDAAPAGFSVGPAGQPAFLSFQRQGAELVALHGSQRDAIPYEESAMRRLRIRLDEARAAHFEFSSDGACWGELGTGSAPIADLSSSGVRLFSAGEGESAKFDDYCR